MENQLPKPQVKEEKKQKKTDSQLVQLAKRMNGLQEKSLKDIDKVQTIQLVLQDLGTMGFIGKFKGLKSLTLVNCGIGQIEGLDNLNRLQELWLNQNQITQLKGLRNLKSLQSLYVCHNQIALMAGLDSLSSLQTLWLCDNRIQVIDDLDSLVNLKQLWLAANKIEHIRTSLDNLINLVDLNISGNIICSFKQALNLNRLPNLKILAFFDPHFSENPICNLCNYQTYVLYHLRNIIKLDTINIQPKLKQITQSTFLRKNMFYNMRIKTVKRSFSTLIKLITKAMQIKADSINDDLSSLWTNLENQEIQSPQIQKMYQARLQEFRDLPRLFQTMKKQLFSIQKSSISKQLTQLNTGGNFRLEQGKPPERWYMSCIDLIRSRFSAAQLQKFGIVDFNIKRLVRIHNKFLKNTFQQRKDQADMSDSTLKRCIQYFFYGVDPKAPYEMDYIIQQGFRSAKEAKQMGLPAYTTMVSSLVAADMPRLLAHRNNYKNLEKFKKPYLQQIGLSDVLTYPSGQILVCKVLIRKSINDPKHPYFTPQMSPSQIFEKEPLDVEMGDQDAIYRVHLNQPRNRLYFMKDNNLILPEYLLQFDYVMQNPKQVRVLQVQDVVVGVQEDQNFICAKNKQLYANDIPKIYNRLVEDVNNYKFDNIEDSQVNLQIRAEDLDKADIGIVKLPIINYLKYCFSKSKQCLLNPNLMQELEGELDLQNISDLKSSKYLNISNIKIKNPETLCKFLNLKILVISFNRITSLKHIAFPESLEKLDLSHNQIPELESLTLLPLMKTLNLSHNDLPGVNSLRPLLKQISLVQLFLLFNPFWVDNPSLQVEQLLPNLKHLNYQKVDRLSSSIQNITLKQITQEFVKQPGKLLQSRTLSGGDWKMNVEGLNLGHCNLGSLKGIQHFSQLRQLIVCNNFISKIEALSSCKLLQEINFENNRIPQLQNLQHLHYLKKLEVGNNKITKISGLQALINLLQLSIEDNHITSLEGLPELPNLLELYIANNKIWDTRQIKNLKDLNKLIILDLSGNPLTRDSSYRVYTLYQLKKLKVLDGINIQIAESEMAKEQYTGRLTDQILKERLDGRRPEDIKELVLINLKLKDFDQVFSMSSFPNLEILDLSNNLFTCTKMLGHLPKLRVLKLTQNKIETLHCCSDISVKKGLNGCSNSLQILDLSLNHLTDFQGLQFCNLKELKILIAQNNQISRIDSLQNLRQLKELRLSKNKIKQIDAMSFNGSNPIKALYLNYNGLKNFNNIQRLVKLSQIYAASNRISEITDLERLVQLNYLKQLDLSGNSLSRKPGYRQAVLQKLDRLNTLDGRQVTQDERQRIQQMSSIDRTSNLPNMYIPQVNPRGVMPMRMGSVNFEGVFTNGSRINIQNLLGQNLRGDRGEPPGWPGVRR